MAVDKTLWDRRVFATFEDGYPCPRCGKGRVRQGSNKIVIEEPQHSKNQHGSDEWEPHWVDEAFTVLLTCDNTVCGEIVAVNGRASEEPFDQYGPDDEPMGTQYATVFRPASLFPAPPLFPVSRKFPAKVQAELRLAFQLYWADLSASASRLRTSLERVLDDKGIPATGVDKAGKPTRLTLFDRIDLFEKQEKDADSAESMNALRVVGNLGTHGDEVQLGDYFDLLEVYEDALLDIYEQKKANLKAKKAALMALKK